MDLPHPRPSLADRFWQTAYRLAFPPATVLRGLLRQRHRGALVAIWVGPALLLVRSSYRRAWSLPGGGVHAHETPEAAAQREMREEIGLDAPALRQAAVVRGVWEGLRDEVHIFELALDALPALTPDNREITGLRLAPREELAALRLTGPVAAYVAGLAPGAHPRPVA